MMCVRHCISFEPLPGHEVIHGICTGPDEDAQRWGCMKYVVNELIDIINNLLPTSKPARSNN